MSSRMLPLERNPDQVSLTIQVNGDELPGRIPILALEVLRQVNRIPYARLRIADGDPALGDFTHSTGGTPQRILVGSGMPRSRL